MVKTRQLYFVGSESWGPNQLQSESDQIAVWLGSLFFQSMLKGALYILHLIIYCLGRILYAEGCWMQMFNLVPWWAWGLLSCFLEDLAVNLKPCILQLQFTRKMRYFSFPYPPLQKEEEERSRDNRTVAVVSTSCLQEGGSLQALTPCCLEVEEWEAEGGCADCIP